MSALSEELESYKLRSRRHRNRALQARDEERDDARAASDFAKAVAAMREALRYLEEIGAPDPEAKELPSEGEIEVAEQLADCWGMLGGVYRAQGDLEQSKLAYDSGYRYESSKRFNILNTYNQVNRLVLRIILNPELLADVPPLVTDGADNEKRPMLDLLHDAADEIERQLREGRRDRAWALADLVMVRVLGRLDGIDGALSALDESSEGDPFPYQSTLKVIRELVQLNLPVRDKLLVVGERLRQRLPDTMQGKPLVSTASSA